MRLLLDTHALIWAMEEPERLGAKAQDLITDPGNTVLVSVVSLWEIAVKMRVGKIKTDLTKLMQRIEQVGFTLIDISLDHLLTLALLPTHHRDPFDHLLIAQAISENASLVSEDRRVRQYAVAVIICSN